MAPSPLAPHFSLTSLIRPNILSLTPYRCARDDYDAGILLDANENALGSALTSASVAQKKQAGLVNGSGVKAADPVPGLDLEKLELHRYPSPLHLPLKQQICDLRNADDATPLPPAHQPNGSSSSLAPLTPANVFLGVGSDEVIDILFRVTCRPGDSEGRGDQALVTPPTYGMYGVCAQVNDVGVVKVDLDVEEGRFQPRLDAIDQALRDAEAARRPINLLFLCSPGNPTGTLIPLSTVRSLLSNPNFKGLLAVDEAYIDFAAEGSSAVRFVREGWENLVVMQTLSKGFGLAGIRLGICFGAPNLIQILNNTKAPYTIGSPVAALALSATSPSIASVTRSNVATLISNRKYLLSELPQLPGMGKVLGGNDANFILMQVLSSSDRKPDSQRANKVYKAMAELPEGKGVVVRYRGNERGCEGCVRITVGSREECEELLRVLKRTLEVIS